MSAVNKNSHREGASGLLKRRFHESWDDVFLIDGLTDRHMTYGQFFSAAMRAKERLVAIGVQAGDKVCVISENAQEVLVCYFACLFLPCVVVPIDPRRGIEEIRTMVNLAKARVVVCQACDVLGIDGQYSAALDSICADMGDGRAGERHRLEELDTLDARMPFLMTVTSGTTGFPKGVLHSWWNLTSSAQAFGQQFPLTSKRVFYHNLSMTYMAGILNTVILPFLFGCRIVLGERFHAQNTFTFWDMPRAYSADVFWFTPAMIQLMLQLDRGDAGVGYMRHRDVIGCVGTASFPHASRQVFQERYGIQLYESYGLTETLLVTTQSPLQPSPDGTVGRPLDGVNLSCSDDGEILICVPWMFLGYADTQGVLPYVGNQFPSGDVGVCLERNCWKITDRKKDLIVRGGFNISPVRLEEYIRTLHLLDEIVIVGMEHSVMGEKIICSFVDASRRVTDDLCRAVNRHVMTALGPDYRIDEFRRVPSVPRNVNGKVNRRQLKELLAHDR